MAFKIKDRETLEKDILAAEGSEPKTVKDDFTAKLINEDAAKEAALNFSLYGEAEKEYEEKRKALDDGKMYVEIKLDNLTASPMNHFRKLDGENWEEFLASIKAHGILNPITVRPIARDKYEILAGHNRVRAAKEAGLETIPANIKDVDDVEASIIIADTNLQRETVTDLEKGWAYRNIFEAISRQGERTDLTSGHSDQKLELDTSGQNDQKLSNKTSAEIIAEKYGVGEKTVRRKIRLTYLLPPIYGLYEQKKLTQEMAEQISYLRSSEQALLDGLITMAKMEFTVDQLKAIRKASESSEKALDDIAIMDASGNGKPEYEMQKKEARPKKYKIDEDLFPQDLKKGMREDYLIKALTYIKEHGIEVV
jgi:hypothetical protein